MDIGKYISSLIHTISKLRKSLQQSLEKQANLEAEVTLLKGKNANLESQLTASKNKKKKNSSNSHIPPSHEISPPKRNNSLRKKSGKKQGGQPGHKGSTLKYEGEVNETISHRPDFCENCGNDLSQAPEELVESRRVIDIPPIKPICIEHEVYQKSCTCGHCTKGIFPNEVKANLQYGSNIEAIVGYLFARQYIPFKRTKELFADVLGLSMSTGTICNMVNSLTKKATPAYEEIKKRISTSTVVGTDETSVKVNTKKHWYWTWQNKCLTYIAYSDNRGFATYLKELPLGLPFSISIHDRYASHFKNVAKSHQICLAHLLRDLNYINETHLDCDWGKAMKNLLLDAMELKKSLKPSDYHSMHTKRRNIETRLTKLLNDHIDKSDSLAGTLQKSLKKCQDSILTFLYHSKVPPDNNGSERAIRNVKIKQKVSAQFRSPKGAHNFAVLRSIIDTTAKNSQNILKTLSIIASS